MKVGDVVILLSGGPAMTVRDVFPNGSVTTNWFVKGKLLEGTFLVENLRAWKPEDKGEGE
jgi:uncharacterized protein YodC (DUF2158 family)